MKPLATADLEFVERQTCSLWEGTSGKRIFLTGATGFFGAWLLETFAHCNRVFDLNMSASVLCRNPSEVIRRLPHLGSEKAIHWIQGDVRTYQFPEGEFDFVLHAATPTTASTNLDTLDLLSTVIDGTQRTIALARESGVQNFLYISSGAVYGPQPSHIERIPEEYRGGPDWIQPQAAYAEGKRVAEMMCSVLAEESEISVRIARCFAFVGPHFPLDQHFAIGNFISDALAGRNISIRGDGSTLRSYLYAADLAVWLWTLLLGQTKPSRVASIYNFGSGEAISILQLAELVTEVIDPSLRVEVAQLPTPGAIPLRYVPDVLKVAKELGLRPTIGLRESIRRTADWYR